MSEPLILPRNCGNCSFWDGDVHCGIPASRGARLITRIIVPALVVCIKHEPKDADDVEAPERLPDGDAAPGPHGH